MTVISEINPHNYATVEVQTQHKLKLFDKEGKRKLVEPTFAR
jgi:hypothetical protein